MALNIKNPQVEQLADEIARITGESKTEAIRQALLERRARLRFRVQPGQRQARLLTFLESEIWARVPDDQLGHAPDRAEREDLLGYGSEGV
jgi:antitoxin VapB